MHLKFSVTFDHLSQEAHLAKNTILSGFDLLLKANLDTDRDGYFYASFFHLSIGIERMLKLAVVAEHMIRHELVPPTEKELRGWGHNLLHLYKQCGQICGGLGIDAFIPPHSDTSAGALLAFLSHYATTSRYHNLNSLSNQQPARSPLAEWWGIASSIFRENIASHRREKYAQKLMHDLDHHGYVNGFTYELDFSGHVMTVFDVLWRQEILRRSAPLAVWEIISLLRPIYDIFAATNGLATALENKKGVKLMVLPYLDEFFPFLLSSRQDALRRKNWLEIFSS